MSDVSIRFGDEERLVTLPADRDVSVLTGGHAGDPRPAADAVRPFLPLIRDAARRAGTVAVLVPDDSRPFPAAEIVPLVLDELSTAGVDEILVLVATGLHRAMPEDALRRHLGSSVMDRVTVRNHDARDPAQLVERGELAPGVPLLLSKAAVEADLRVLLGCFEPHQYHGFSGGYKVLGIGCAGEATIAHTHGRAFLTDERVRPGLSPGNPFRDAVARAGRAAGPAVALALIPGPTLSTTYGAAGGDPDETWAALALRGPHVFGGRIDGPADVILAGVPAPKSRSLYQATRAASNLILADHPALRPGGTFVLAAPLEDGVGTGEGERRFGEALRSRGLAILDEETPLRPGEQRAWIVARLLRDHRIVVAGARRPDEIEALGLEVAPDPVEAALAVPGRLVVVPDGLHVLPFEA